MFISLFNIYDWLLRSKIYTKYIQNEFNIIKYTFLILYIKKYLYKIIIITHIYKIKKKLNFKNDRFNFIKK